MADFGFATSLRDLHYQKQVVGLFSHFFFFFPKNFKQSRTYNWLAPESIKKEGYGEGVDIWAIGVVALEMLQKDPPYWGLQKQEIMDKIKTQGIYLEKTTKCSNGIRDFFDKCVKMDPKDRTPAKELLKHPWILEKVPLYKGYTGKKREWQDDFPFFPINQDNSVDEFENLSIYQNKIKSNDQPKIKKDKERINDEKDLMNEKREENEKDLMNEKREENENKEIKSRENGSEECIQGGNKDEIVIKENFLTTEELQN